MPRVATPLAVVVLLAALAVATSAAPVAAQDATPAAGATQFPITPDPAECMVEPRSADELLALWYDAEGTPIAAATPMAQQATSVTIPLGPPADEATAAAVAATVSEVFACFEAGDALRAYALFTDDLARQFGPEPGTPREEAEAFLAGGFPEEATPEATPEGDALGGEVAESQIVAVTDVMELADGRVGAFVVTREAGELDTVFLALERAGDRLLADELVDFAPLEGGGEDEGA